MVGLLAIGIITATVTLQSKVSTTFNKAGSAIDRSSTIRWNFTIPTYGMSGQIQVVRTGNSATGTYKQDGYPGIDTFIGTMTDTSFLMVRDCAANFGAGCLQTWNATLSGGSGSGNATGSDTFSFLLTPG